MKHSVFYMTNIASNDSIFTYEAINDYIKEPGFEINPTSICNRFGVITFNFVAFDRSTRLERSPSTPPNLHERGLSSESCYGRGPSRTPSYLGPQRAAPRNKRVQAPEAVLAALRKAEGPVYCAPPVQLECTALADSESSAGCGPKATGPDMRQDRTRTPASASKNQRVRTASAVSARTRGAIV